MQIILFFKGRGTLLNNFESCCQQYESVGKVYICFFLIVFGGTEVPIILNFPLPPRRGQPTVKCHPRWQPISGLAVHCRLGRLLDSNPGLQFLQSGVATNEPPLLPRKIYTALTVLQYLFHTYVHTYVLYVCVNVKNKLLIALFDDALLTSVIYSHTCSF